jgi:hypothetical protein
MYPLNLALKPIKEVDAIFHGSDGVRKGFAEFEGANRGQVIHVFPDLISPTPHQPSAVSMSALFKRLERLVRGCNGGSNIGEGKVCNSVNFLVVTGV